MKINIGSFLSKHKPSVPSIFKLHHTDPDIVPQLSDRLRSVFHAVPHHRPVVIVCVGTDRSTGDALGPLVGTNLSKLSAIPIYGTLDEPVHAINLSERLEHIQHLYKNPFIVAIDACLSQLSSVGTIQAGDGPVKPGAGVNKNLPPVGEFHITGIVNVGGFMEYFVLQNTRLSLVFTMAEIIAESLRIAVEERLTSIAAFHTLE